MHFSAKILINNGLQKKNHIFLRTFKHIYHIFLRTFLPIHHIFLRTLPNYGKKLPPTRAIFCRNQALLKYLAKAGIRNICFRNTYRKFIGITEERTLISGSLAGDQMNILETRRFNLLVIGSRSRGRQ